MNRRFRDIVKSLCPALEWSITAPFFVELTPEFIESLGHPPSSLVISAAEFTPVTPPADFKDRALRSIQLISSNLHKLHLDFELCPRRRHCGHRESCDICTTETASRYLGHALLPAKDCLKELELGQRCNNARPIFTDGHLKVFYLLPSISTLHLHNLVDSAGFQTLTGSRLRNTLQDLTISGTFTDQDLLFLPRLRGLRLLDLSLRRASPKVSVKGEQ